MAKLLLVEDDNNLREIYEARLQAEGYNIVSAKDGEEALVVAKAEKPDLVISDVMMPKISGFEMLDILRNTDELKGVKVIMLTALGQSDDQQRADKLGADRYLVKSQVTLEDIIKVTHELLGDQPAAGAAAEPAVAADPGATPTPTSNAASSTPTVVPEPAAPPAPAPAARPAEPKVEPPAPEPEPTPESKTEPIASPAPEPEPEPAAPPAPAPAPDPVSDAQAEPEPAPAPDAAKTDNVAKPTDQEEADVEAKIEDFVTGASSEPTAPATATPTPAVPPEPDAASGPDPAQDKPGNDPLTSDDKLMSDAVDTLVASAGEDDAVSAAPSDTPAPAAKAATTIPVSDDTDSGQVPPKPASAQPQPPASDDKDDADDTANAAADGPVVHEKVIKPLDSKPKKDINELLAEEEAKSASMTPGTTIAGSAADDEDKPAGAPMAPPSASADNDEPKPAGTDPSSIAL